MLALGLINSLQINEQLIDGRMESVEQTTLIIWSRALGNPSPDKKSGDQHGSPLFRNRLLA